MNRSIIISILALFCSCSTRKIASVKDPAFNTSFNKVLITLKSSEESKAFINSLAVKLKTELAKRGVESTLHLDLLLPLTLETDADIVEKNMLLSNTYNAEAIIIIEQMEIRSYRSQLVGTTLNVRLYVPDNKKPIWKGIVSTDMPTIFSNLANKSAVALVEKLHSDQIIN